MIGKYPSTVVVPNSKSGMGAGGYVLIGLAVVGILAYVDYNHTHLILNKKPKETKPVA